MRIAILIAGFCRPNKEYCINNINLLKDSFKDYDYKTIFIDYNNENSKYIINNTHLDNIFLISRQSDEEINKRFPNVKCKNAKPDWKVYENRPEGSLVNQTNIWRMHEKQFMGLDFIEKSLQDTTHICISRPCTRVEVDPKEFIENSYNVWNQTPFAVDDRFAFGEKELIFKMSSFRDPQHLNKYELVDSREEFLRLLQQGYKIQIEQVPFKQFILRPEK